MQAFLTCTQLFLRSPRYTDLSRHEVHVIVRYGAASSRAACFGRCRVLSTPCLKLSTLTSSRIVMDG